MKATITLDEISASVLRATAMLSRRTAAEVLAALNTVAISDVEELSEKATNDLVKEGERLSEDGFAILVQIATDDEKTDSRGSDKA